MLVLSSLPIRSSRPARARRLRPARPSASVALAARAAPPPARRRPRRLLLHRQRRRVVGARGRRQLVRAANAQAIDVPDSSQRHCTALDTLAAVRA